MPTPDLSNAEGILRELLDVRTNRETMTPEDVRSRQKTAWTAARKLLGVKGKGDKAATTA